MTPRERAKEATWEAGCPDWGSDDRERLEMAVEHAINAAVEEKDKRIAEIEAALRIFEDGASWEVFPGLREPTQYVWRHDSDPRVLAQDAHNNGGTK